MSDTAIPIVGTQDDNTGTTARPSTPLNIWELDDQVERPTPSASLALATQLPVAAFDSIFPCAPTSRDCLPQPGIIGPGAVPRHPVLSPANDCTGSPIATSASTSRWSPISRSKPPRGDRRSPLG